jgi:enoyl-CoA hydratase
MSQDLLYSQEGAIAIVQFNQPQRKNPLSRALRDGLREALHKVAGDASIRALVITGGEDIFCAGADIAEITAESSENPSAEREYQRGLLLQGLFNEVESLPQPVIAAVGGFAFGGGCELALACDFRIASQNAVFAFPEVKVGAVPGAGGTQRLPRIIGPARAKEMILTGDRVDAQSALALGLATKVVPQGKVIEEGKIYASKFATIPGLAVKMAKKLINRSLDLDLTSGLELEARCAGSIGTSHDFQEGFRAFIEKRKPTFTGN